MVQGFGVVEWVCFEFLSFFEVFEGFWRFWRVWEEEGRGENGGVGEGLGRFGEMGRGLGGSGFWGCGGLVFWLLAPPQSDTFLER